MELMFNNMTQMRGLTSIYDASKNQDFQKQSVPRRKRTQTTYTNISNDCREELVKRVTQNKEKIIEVAKDLKLNYSTAKSILRVYKAQQRVEKIPQKLRIKRKRRSQKLVLPKPQFSTAFAATVMSMKSEEQSSASVSLGTESVKSVKLEVEDSGSNLKVEEQETQYKSTYAQQIFPQMYQTSSSFIDHAALQQRILSLQKNKELEIAARVKPSYHAGYYEQINVPMAYAGKMESFLPNTTVDSSIFFYNKLMLQKARACPYNEIVNNHQTMMTPNLFLGNRVGYNLF